MSLVVRVTGDEQRRGSPLRTKLQQQLSEYFGGKKFHESWSHSGEWLAVAAALLPVGIDIEVAQEFRGTSPRIFLSESDEITLNVFQRPQIVGWTMKEAVFKADPEQTSNLTAYSIHEQGRLVVRDNSRWCIEVTETDAYTLAIARAA